MNTAVKENVVAVIPPRRKPQEAAVPAAEEKILEAGSKDITGKVDSIIIETEADYGEAAKYGKRVKAQIKAVKDYWKPLKENAAKAHKEICAREKEMLAPLAGSRKHLERRYEQLPLGAGKEAVGAGGADAPPAGSRSRAPFERGGRI